MTDDELQAIKARADAATPGPWGTFDTDDEVHMCAIGVSTNGHEPWFELNASEDENGHQHVVAMTLLQSPRYACHASGKWAEDAEFIARARSDIPALLAEVERLKAELAILKPLEITAREYSVGWATQSALCDEARRYALQQYKMTSRVE